MTDLEQHLGDALADGKITDHDAEEVRRFADFLARVGPADGGKLREYVLESRENREYVYGDDADLFEVSHPEHFTPGGSVKR